MALQHQCQAEQPAGQHGDGEIDECSPHRSIKAKRCFPAACHLHGGKQHRQSAHDDQNQRAEYRDLCLVGPEEGGVAVDCCEESVCSAVEESVGNPCGSQCHDSHGEYSPTVNRLESGAPFHYRTYVVQFFYCVVVVHAFYSTLSCKVTNIFRMDNIFSLFFSTKTLSGCRKCRNGLTFRRVLFFFR